ncbi:hypothetical protein BMR1_03g01475 [Babesia microti strain RI]|uniref:Uncharacterized protein n=1 Tax=Babesia microti (strain RI) TaxID=1133968 RepID=A0A0K3AMD4_BABMR|nr:hypothetical protein BMR1_03g01475 [Babesia microti strain RI]CTQ40894.1 hypothetical protein BMR1_03g01475 [Babesia microti strain RI]|eukprot:XP_012648905.1 hypothetical protein BMR1_03g01475 [Babesia microti strain RI]
MNGNNNREISVSSPDYDENNQLLDEIGRIKSLHEKVHAEWYKRKKFCEQLIITISSMTEIPSTQLLQEMDIEDDPHINST